MNFGLCESDLKKKNCMSKRKNWDPLVGERRLRHLDRKC